MGYSKDGVILFQLWCCSAVNWEPFHKSSRLIDRKTEIYRHRWIYSLSWGIIFIVSKVNEEGWNRLQTTLLVKKLVRQSKRIFATNSLNLIWLHFLAPTSLVPFALLLIKIQTRDALASKELSGQGFSVNRFSLEGFALPWVYAKWPP